MRNTRQKGFSANHAEVRNRHTDSYFISEYYPINFVAGDYYVFFDTLWTKPHGTTGINLASKAATWLYGPMRNPTRNFRGKTNEKYIEALNFLQSATEIEYIREASFLDNYVKRSPELKKVFDECQNAGPDKYLNLINAMNLILKNSNTYGAELNKEIKRIEDRKKILSIDRKAISEKRVDEKGNLQLTSAEWALRRQLAGDDTFGDTTFNPYFNMDGNKIFRSMFTKNSDFSIIAEKIIVTYGAKLLSQHGSKVRLNQRQAVAMIKVLIREAQTQLAIRYKEGLQKAEHETSMARKKRINNRLNDMVKEGGVLDTFFNNFLNSDSAADALTSIADQNKIPIDTSEMKNLEHSTKVFNERIKKMWQDEKKSGRTTDSYRTWRAKNNLTEKDIKEYVYLMSDIKVQTYYTSEEMAVTDLVQQGFYAALGNHANAPTDVNAGKIICQFTYEENPEAYKKVLEAQQKMNQAQQRMLKKQTAITTIDTYKQNTEALQEMLEEQEKILLELKSDLKDLVKNVDEMISCINIHETIKGYASINSTSSEFEGAKFGTLITDQLNIINELLSSGGITQVDKDWLIFALINCGKGDIGSDNRHALEDYLSGYIGLLMFSDASFIASDITDYMNFSKASNISNIHLYVLNNKYVPASFILHETYKAMTQFLNGINQITNGTTITLTPYNSPRSSLVWEEGISEETKSPWTIEELKSGAAWNRERDEALAQTHLDMQFLGNFLGLLRNLADQLPLK